MRRLSTIVAVVAVLSACKGPTPTYTTEGWSFRGGGYIYGSEVEDEVDDTLNGISGGGRIEIAKAFDGARRNVEVGLRVSVGASGLDDGGETMPPFTLEANSFDFFGDAVLRGYIPTKGKVRPYGEAFVGYSLLSADFTVPQVPGPAIEEDFDGLSLGAGIGVEIDVTEDFLISLGGEYRYADLSSDVGDATLNSFGGVLMFGTRW